MTSKTIAMIFPGQGSQAVGMGRELAQRHPTARTIFERADTALRRPLSKLCFEGPEEELKQTANTQPALYTASSAALAVLHEAGIMPAWVAGHSLGEYTALYAAEVFAFETGLRLVETRGRVMFNAGQSRPGTMAAILNLDNDQVAALCEAARPKGTVVPANLNAPGQVVISGEPEAIAEVVRLAQEAGSRRSVMLPVSGAFHSPLVESAVPVMRRALAAERLQAPRCHFVANVSASEVKDAEAIREGLAQQIVSPVRWAESIETMARGGANLFIEVGPGKVLTGLLKRINPDLKWVNFSVPGDLEKVRAALAS